MDMNPKYKRSWMRFAVSMAVVASLVLAGCGGQQPASAPAPKPATAPAGSTVSMPIVADPLFNPWHPNAFLESLFINRILFEGLTKPGKDLAPAPALATSWVQSPNGLQWTFTLRDNVKWHDGKPFTADDVAFTFMEIVLNKELGTKASSFDTVAKVEAKDPKTVVFTLKQPFASLLTNLSTAGIMPKHLFQGKDPWKLVSFNKENPVGTGAFKFSKATAGQSVELVANKDYYGGAPKIDRLVFKVVADQNAQVAQALSGDLSIMILDNKAALDRIKAAPNLKTKPAEQVQWYWISANQKYPELQDARVRQAILWAIDRQKIIDTVDKGYATIANAPIAPAMKSYYNPNVTKYTYNPQKAKDLLAAAGWKDTNGDGIVEKNGKPFKLTLDIGKKGNLEAVAQMVQQYMKAAGFDVTLNSMEWNAMIQKVVVQRDYEITLNWWSHANDPDVYSYFHSTGAGTGNNIPGYKDAKIDKMLEEGRATGDPAKRKAIYDQFE